MHKSEENLSWPTKKGNEVSILVDQNKNKHNSSYCSLTAHVHFGNPSQNEKRRYMIGLTNTTIILVQWYSCSNIQFQLWTDKCEMYLWLAFLHLLQHFVILKEIRLLLQYFCKDLCIQM